MHGVVTPNWLAATSGRSSPSSTGAALTMPAIAAAALAMMRALRALTPAMSTTDAASIMSLSPMIGRVSEAAIVDTMSFGTPTGSARMACAAIEVPPEPPERQHAVAAALLVQPRARPRSRPRPSR